MSTTKQNILKEALALDVKQRAELAQKLIDSLDDSSLEEEWYNLAEERLSQLTSGKIEGKSWEQIIAAIK